MPAAGAIRQALLRDVNEQIARIDAYFDEELELVCECRDCCFQRISLPRNQYEAIRRHPSRFVVKPGHRSTDEQVVDEFRKYLVVENVEAGDELEIDLRASTVLGSGS
jgi:hypothetical protein